MGRWGSSRVVGVVVVGVLALGGVVGVLGGSGPRVSVGSFLDGSALVSDLENGAVVQVDGGSARPVAKVSFRGAAGAREMRVVQRGGRAYVSVTLADGSVRLFRVEGSDLSSGSSRRVGSGQVLVRGGSRAYLVDRGRGRVQAIDARSLRARGRVLRFGGRIDVAAGDDGVLVVARRGAGRVVPVVGSSRRPALRVGGRGSRLVLSVVAGRVVVFDEAAGVLRVVERGRWGLRVRVAPRLGRFLVPEVVEPAEWVGLDRAGGRGALVRVDLADGGVVRVGLDGDVSGVGAPLVTPGAVFLVRSGGREVLVVDPVSGALRSVEPGVVGRGGVVDVFVQSGRLFVNDPAGARGAVIDADGRVRYFDKYTPDIPDAGDPLPAPPRSLPPPAAPSPPPPATDRPGRPRRPAVRHRRQPPRVVGRPGEPGRPTAIAGNRRVDLSWTPADDGGGTIDHYTVTCTPACGGRGTTFQVPGSVTAYPVDGLRNGREYTFSLTATNEVGTGPASDRISARPTGDVPGVPTGVTARANPDGTVTIAWQTPDDTGRGITGYEVQPHHGSEMLASYEAGGGDLSFTTPRGAFRSYYDTDEDAVSFTVSAVGPGPRGSNVSSAFSDPSAEVRPFEPPAAPTGASGKASDRKVTVTFGAAKANGRPVEAYRILEGPSKRKAWEGPDPGSVSLDMPNGTEPDLRVQARNEAGWGEEVTVATGTPYAAPGVGGSVARVGSRNAEVTVSVDWKGAPVGSCRASSGSWNSACSRLTLSGLAAGRGFSVDVTATNVNGDAATGRISGSTKNPSSVIRWGGSAQGQPTTDGSGPCNASCRWIDADLRDFAWNSTVTVACWGNDSKAGVPPGSFWNWRSFTVNTDGNGNVNLRNSGCFFGYLGKSVYLVVEGTRSNTITR